VIGSHPMRIGILQRVLPAYRVPLFDILAEKYGGNVSVFAGAPRKREALLKGGVLRSAQYWQGTNRHLFNGPFYVCWQSGLFKWLKSWRPQVLVMEANPRYLRSPAAVRWMRRCGGKVIGWGLGAPEMTEICSGLRTYFRTRFIRRFDALITYSRVGAQEYAALGLPVEKIFIAPNAAAKKPVDPMPERSRKYRGGRPVVVFVGRLQERKRVDTLIRACAEQSPGQQPLLWIIGDGPQRPPLEALANEIYPYAEFLGAQHGDDLANYLRLADLFVLPGTGGLAVQEAMSYGLPVIVGVADGTQGDLVRAENGWQLADDSVEALRDAIRDALVDIQSLREKGKESYRIVSQEINLEKMAAVFSRVIDMMMEA